MILIEKADIYKKCNCCGSNTNIKELYFNNNLNNTNNGVSIFLCDKCQMILIKLLSDKR